MSYLERNSRLIREVSAGVQLQKWVDREEDSDAKFYSNGSYHSKELGSEVFVGIKKPRESQNNPDDIRDRFIFELAVMSVVAKNLPHLLPDLPLFYGLLTKPDGTPIAIVTEDFSKDGKNEVEQSQHVPWGFEELFVEESLEEDFLLNISFVVTPNERPPIGALSVEREWRLGDFYPLVHVWKRDEHRKHFPEQEVEDHLSEYTLKINHDQ